MVYYCFSTLACTCIQIQHCHNATLTDIGRISKAVCEIGNLCPSYVPTTRALWMKWRFVPSPSLSYVAFSRLRLLSGLRKLRQCYCRSPALAFLVPRPIHQVPCILFCCRSVSFWFLLCSCFCCLASHRQIAISGFAGNLKTLHSRY